MRRTLGKQKRNNELAFCESGLARTSRNLLNGNLAATCRAHHACNRSRRNHRGDRICCRRGVTQVTRHCGTPAHLNRTHEVRAINNARPRFGEGCVLKKLHTRHCRTKPVATVFFNGNRVHFGNALDVQHKLRLYVAVSHMDHQIRAAGEHFCQALGTRQQGRRRLSGFWLLKTHFTHVASPVIFEPFIHVIE